MASIAIASSAVVVALPQPPPPFEALYATHFDYVWHSLRRLGVPQRHLADVTHDVFVGVFRGLETFDGARPVRPWLFGIACRVASNHLRLGRNRHEQVDDHIEATDQAPLPEAQLQAAQKRALVQAALDAIEIDRRAVLILHDIEEQPASEIAAALQIPVKTVYSRLRVAREEFVAAVRRVQLRRGER